MQPESKQANTASAQSEISFNFIMVLCNQMQGERQAGFIAMIVRPLCQETDSVYNWPVRRRVLNGFFIARLLKVIRLAP